MATINPYLNFNLEAEAAFTFYKSVFGGEFSTFQRFKEVPGMGDNLSDAEKEGLMHVALPIEGSVLMGSDVLPSRGHPKAEGNNFYISLQADSKEEADKLFNGLSAGGTVEMPLQDTFWNAYFGMFQDKFGVRWMINYDYPQG
ncbi:MAG: VOC family protein [Trueperaceae bacterium]|nr:VOC family protein [Trueperaceae bacterium]